MKKEYTKPMLTTLGDMQVTTQSVSDGSGPVIIRGL